MPESPLLTPTAEHRRLAIIEQDPWLQPVEAQIEARHARYLSRMDAIEKSAGTIVDYANAHLYFGFHYHPLQKGWWFREWLPGAFQVYLFGDFNDWRRTELPLQKGTNGVWSIFLSDEMFQGRLVHGSRVKMLVQGANGFVERIPAYIRRAVQDELTKDFCGQLWYLPTPFEWDGDCFDIRTVGSLLIYECHVGMALEQEGVGSYCEFTRDRLPYIQAAGYNTLQLMGVAEHPYYGSFGYHVSNFFAPSSRFGTPEELKALIKRAHELGIGVIMDLVQAHYVKNINEGLNLLDGTDLYSPPGEAGYQSYWDSQLFDYGKEGVQHFLLSNIKYWIEEFHFDGFRFDGVTSMIYHHHGYTEFDSREKFFTDINEDALTYLTLANRLVHELRPCALTIAEDVSGMPGMCHPISSGGVGFDYRLGMAVPDYWIQLLEQMPDEQWDIGQMWQMMTNRLWGVKTVAYCESHDQAMVGDKTLAFRLMDQEMYHNMNREAPSIIVDRGMALHKMIRLFTISLAGEAYLNFMGNEFGHPEWIDFPREGNDWSYAHARRQWSLATDGFLRYSFLATFDRAMLDLITAYRILSSEFATPLNMDNLNKTIVFTRHRLVFIFNWHPAHSISDYIAPVPEAGKYEILLSTDAREFGGVGRIDQMIAAFSEPHCCDDGVVRHYIKVYNLSRSALVLHRVD